MAVWLVTLAGAAALVIAASFTDLPTQIRYAALAAAFGATVAASETVFDTGTSRCRPSPARPHPSTSC